MLAGANVIYGAGMLDSGMTFGFGQLVADNEAIRMLRRTLVGVPTDDESLAVDLIPEIGVGGEFISSLHTMKYVRDGKVIFIPELLDKESRSVWEMAGSKTFADLADEKARHILETYKPEPLPCTDKLRQLVDDAEKEYAKTIKKKK